MKYGVLLWMVLGACVIGVVGLMIKLCNLEEEVRRLGENNQRMISSLQDTMKATQASVSAEKQSAPGLGEYMTTIQLDALAKCGLPLTPRIGIWRVTSSMN
jgi:hypothetical protein